MGRCAGRVASCARNTSLPPRVRKLPNRARRAREKRQPSTASTSHRPPLAETGCGPPLSPRWTLPLPNGSDSSEPAVVASAHVAPTPHLLTRPPLPSQDPETRSEILALHEAKSYDELSTRFSSRIAFGTAGLRARMQAGTAFMNSLVILQATQGLATYACEVIPGAMEMGVVVGHDHRWRSSQFAELAAGAFRAQGMKVYLFDGLVHTPMVVRDVEIGRAHV